MDDSTTTSGATAYREFYLPGTFQFGHGPGRIERFLRRTFGRRDGEDRPTVVVGGREFYLPGTPDVRPVTRRKAT